MIVVDNAAYFTPLVLFTALSVMYHSIARSTLYKMVLLPRTENADFGFYGQNNAYMS